LRQANPAVVIGAFKCIFVFMDADTRPRHEVLGTILPPVLTLVSHGNIEIQYIVLRTLTLFSQKYPKTLSKEIRIFFCKYNDPTYVKAEKLSIITSNCGPSNATLVLDELAEYCNSVDVDFVCRSVRGIGEIALKMESCARKCVDILVNLVESKATYAIEQSIIVLTDIFRKFPGQFESIIEKVCQSLDQLKNPQARAAGIWILGEYNELIEKVDVILDPFLDCFIDEAPLVQLQLISTIVKIYLNKPDETRDQLQFILNEATKTTMPPDIRNRALFYWRMLSQSADAAKQFVQFRKTDVEHSGLSFNDEVLHELIANMGQVAGVLHILPSQFVAQKQEVAADDEDVGRLWKPVQVSAITIYTDWSPIQFWIQILNKTDHPISQFALAVNLNGSGFAINPHAAFPSEVPPGETCEAAATFSFKLDAIASGKKAAELEFALKTSDGIQYFRDTIDTRKAFGKSGLNSGSYVLFLAQHTEGAPFDIERAKVADERELTKRNLTVLASPQGGTVVGFTIAGIEMVCSLEARGTGVHGTIRGESAFFMLVKETAKYTFCRE
jgi:hypothetical protein